MAISQIFDFIAFFKDIQLINISSKHSSTLLPCELNNKNVETVLFDHTLLIENYSNSTINKIAIKYKFRTKYKPVIYDHEDQKYEFCEEKNTLIINDLLPKNKLLIRIYPDVDDANYHIEPIVYLDGSLLTWKSKLITSIFDFFKSKFSIIVSLMIILPLLFSYYIKQNIYVSLEDTNKTLSKKEIIDEKMFNYYKRQGFNPSLSKMNIINTPAGFYEQEKLKKTIRANCDERFILAVNNVDSFEELFKLKQIMICEPE